jgi:hypothetical protein
MNPQVQQAWVKALRSGEYKQGRTRLRAGDKFCCLGVLCDLHQKAGLGRWDGTEYFDGAEDEDHTALLLPDAVMEWAGLSYCSGCFVHIGTRKMLLSNHNDEGASFADLANAIEEQL